MPTYEYKCDACGHAFEAFQSIKADPIKRCPKCKKLKVRRLISSGAGLIFKGSGFYITDYRDKNYSESAKADSAAAASSGGSDGAKSGGDSTKPADAGAAKKEGAADAKPSSAPAPSATAGGESSAAKKPASDSKPPAAKSSSAKGKRK